MQNIIHEYSNGIDVIFADGITVNILAPEETDILTDEHRVRARQISAVPRLLETLNKCVTDKVDMHHTKARLHEINDLVTQALLECSLRR